MHVENRNLARDLLSQILTGVQEPSWRRSQTSNWEEGLAGSKAGEASWHRATVTATTTCQGRV
jgi:hypothetical protein